jgi:hypothetical protein
MCAESIAVAGGVAIASGHAWRVRRLRASWRRSLATLQYHSERHTVLSRQSLCLRFLNLACRFCSNPDRKRNLDLKYRPQTYSPNMYLACYGRLAAGIAIPAVAVLITPKDGTPLIPPPKSTSTKSTSTEHKTRSPQEVEQLVQSL